MNVAHAYELQNDGDKVKDHNENQEKAAERRQQELERQKRSAERAREVNNQQCVQQ